MLEFIAPLGGYIAQYIPEISIAFIACFLVMLGNDINRLVRKLMIRQPFILRTVAFILLNAFGYGLLIVKASPYLASWLRSLDSEILILTILIAFSLIGIWAQKIVMFRAAMFEERI
ncbi:membrane protein [Vibrio sp. MACH09]|uniref:DUF3392 domain-containing protein n=1 Tax=Vibrio sp. MACH09 TaxID=3025122 RepID=UPI002791B466|nr:DUF3392 domain-containing protein [Vibrio sp. MACH09]GLO60824.1 membrane protein [Vibrio sp. MACH09]